MLTPPSGTGKYTTHGPHYAALWSHYAALGPRPNGLRPSGSIMGPSGSIMFGPRAVYFPVSLGQGQHIIPLFHMPFETVPKTIQYPVLIQKECPVQFCVLTNEN